MRSLIPHWEMRVEYENQNSQEQAAEENHCWSNSVFCLWLIVEGLYTQYRGRAPVSGQNARAGGGEGLPLAV